MSQAGWAITDHVCRACAGRVLQRSDSEGVLVRCADCGSTVTVPVDQDHPHLALCACGTKTRGAGKVKLVCVPNKPTPEFPAQIVVQEAP